MTPAEALRELLARLGASNGVAVLVSDEELSGWPGTAVYAMKNAGLLGPATPAASVICPGCEQQCSMPVETLPTDGGTVRSFIVCDKREDISRVPVSDAMLKQWSASFTSLAALVIRLLGTTGTGPTTGQRSELGVLRGRKHSSHVVLVADGRLRLHVAGHAAELFDVLKLDNGAIAMDRGVLERFVDKPITGGGDTESSQQRRKRLAGEIETEKNRGTKAFLRTVAAREGISIQRLKQILGPQGKQPQKRPSSSVHSSW